MNDNTNIEISYDEKLWFYHKGCKGKHYLIGNPHTHPGRMYAWCPEKQRTFFVSKSEIGDSSIEAGYWIQGFLYGNQPKPPEDDQIVNYYESKEYTNWQNKLIDFMETGYWEYDFNNEL